MGLLRRLFTARPFYKLDPGIPFVLSATVSGAGKVLAAVSDDRSFGIVYSPLGEPFALDLAALSCRRCKESWFDPRYGSMFPIHTGDNGGIQTYTPPTSGRGNDWVLVVEDEAAHYPAP